MRQAFRPALNAPRLYFFVAEYDSNRKAGDGGGIEDEGEDIEVLEMTIDEAIGAMESGEIQDGKTIMLLQYAVIHLFSDKRSSIL